MKEFHQHGPEHAGYGMTNDFRSAKEAIYHASAVNPAAGRCVRVDSDGASHAVRIEAAKEVTVVVDDRDPGLSYTGAWSQLCGGQRPRRHGNVFERLGCLRRVSAFTGTSVRWISAKNHNLGLADVYLDGVKVAEGVDAYAPSKQHQQALFESDGLANGLHTLKIVVRGDKNPSAENSYVLMDGFSAVPPPPAATPRLRLNINRQWAYDLGWGNYGRSSRISSGFSDTVRIRLMDEP